MKIQYKIPLLLLIIIVFSSFVNMFVINGVVLKSFQRLEEKEVLNKAKSVNQNLQHTVDSLGTRTDDWANWSDLYDYANGTNNAFPQVNIDEKTFEALKINFIAVIDSNNNLLIGESYDLLNHSFIDFDALLINSIFQSLKKSSNQIVESVSGIAYSDNKPVILALRTLHRTDGSGKYVGQVLFARYIDTEILAAISTPGSVKSEMLPAESLRSDPEYASIYALLKKNAYFTHSEGELYSESYYLASDLSGAPAFVIREKFIRDIYNEGKKSVGIFTWYYFAFTLVSSLVFYYVIRKQIIVKLLRLIREIRDIGQQNNSLVLLENYGTDEFGMVASSFNDTRRKLQLTTREKTFQEKQYELLLNVMVEAVAVEDKFGKLRFVNNTFQRYFGYEMEEVMGKKLQDLLTYSDIYGKPLPKDYLDDLARRNQKGKSVSIRITGKNTSFIASVSSAMILHESTYDGLIRVFHDVTSQVEFEKQKDDFFSIASHELRTPLTVIAGSIDNILSGYGKSQLSDIDKKSLESAMKNSERLIRLVHDYLNISRIEQGRVVLNITSVNPCDCVEKIREQFKAVLIQKGISLEFHCDRTHENIFADEDKLLEVLINLVGNSLKFTEKGSIEIIHSIEANYLITTIHDTGMGIEPEYQHVLFARFQQGSKKTTSRVAEGSGLGLYISKEFLRLMGGDIWLVESVLGKGTTFAFRLPLVKK